MSSEGNTGFQIAFWGLAFFLIGLFFSFLFIADEGWKYGIEAIIESTPILCMLVLGFIAFVLGAAVYIGELLRIRSIEKDPIKSREYKKQIQQEKEAAEKARELRIKERAAELEAERQAAIYSQTNGAPWERFYTFPCPGCGHYKVRPATWDDKKMSVAFWGIHSSKTGARYKCTNCGRMWS